MSSRKKTGLRHGLLAMSQALEATSKGFQIIVLDHAGKDVWGGIPLVHVVDDWRNGEALIPADWMI